jgi:enolase
MPVPMMNVINGGTHAQNSLDFQEFMIVPHGAPRFSEALRYGAETFHALKTILNKRGYSTGVGDEGGFAPSLRSNEEACDLIVEAISAAGYRPCADISIALDPAASAFWSERGYDLKKSGAGLKTAAELTEMFAGWITRYPIVSLEDALGEKDWTGFPKHTAALGDRVQIVGDDLYVTNADFIQRGIEVKATNAVLIKLNQIGTVTETIRAIELCRRAGWAYVVSHRSGETEDSFIADFTVAMGGGQIKTGSLCRSERIAKYNRLLEIEAELGDKAVFATPFAGRNAK